MTFIIPYPPKKQMSAFCKRFGMNALYSGKHWSKRREDAEYWHTLVRSELRCQNVPRMTFSKPVQIIFRSNDGMDCSNHAYIGKLIEDALKGWIIDDDSRRYVQRIVHEFHDKNYILVEIKEV